MVKAAFRVHQNVMDPVATASLGLPPASYVKSVKLRVGAVLLNLQVPTTRACTGMFAVAAIALPAIATSATATPAIRILFMPSSSFGAGPGSPAGVVFYIGNTGLVIQHETCHFERFCNSLK
jgi:hypothetical protein